MKAVTFLLAIIELAAAKPQFQQLQQGFQIAFQQAARPVQRAVRTIQAGPAAYILRYDANLGAPNGFSYDVEQSDDQEQAVVGEIKNEGTDEESLAVEGQYSYVGDDGKTYSVHYTADEDGFQPAGDHIPPAANTRKFQSRLESVAIVSLANGGLGR